MPIILLSLLLASTPSLATPSEGVPLQVRRGFFTETDIGGFLTVGGRNGYSNLQTYVQLGVGYQFVLPAGLVPVGFNVGIGSNAQNCHAELRGNKCTAADNFTLTFVGVNAGYLHRVVQRLFLGGKVTAGWTVLDPDPVGTGTGVKNGLNVGLAASLEYATNMDHFSIGFDLGVRTVLVGSPPIVAVVMYPRVQYTF